MGDAARRSTRMNATSASTATTMSATIVGDPQMSRMPPTVESARLATRSAAVVNTAARMPPATSTRAADVGLGSLTRSAMITTASTPMGTLM